LVTKWRLPLVVFLLLALVVAGAWSLTRLNETERAGLELVESKGEAEQEAEGYEEEQAEETEFLMGLGDYFATRYTYPTGRFDQRWLLQAAAQDRLVLNRIPAGRVIYSQEGNVSPLTLDPNQFTSLGPQPLQSDGCLNCYNYGHVAGRTNVIATDPISTSVAYLGSDGGGVWKTTNCCSTGTTWTPVTDDPLISTIAIGDIVIDPNNHNTVYAGTGDLRYGSFSFGAAGVLKSLDQGETWTVLGADVFAPPRPQPPGGFPQYQAIGKVQVDPRDSNIVIVGAKTGVYFSYDAGANWTGPCLTNSFTAQRQDTTGLLVSDNGASTDLYAAVGTRGFPTPVQPDLGLTGANGVYKTTIPSSGCPASWTLLNNGWPAGTGDGNPANDLVGRIDMAMAPSNHNVIYAQVAHNVNSSATLGVWRTVDGGLTWTQQASPSDFTGCGGGVGQTWYNAGVTVDPNNPDVVFLSMIDVFRSTNGADTFTNLTCGYAGGHDVHVDNHARAFVGGSSSTLLIGSDGGVYLTTDATASSPTFDQLNDSLSTIEFYSGDITDNFANSASPGINAGAQDNGSSVYVWSGDPGPALWQLRKGGDGMYAQIEPVLGQRWYQESQNGNLAVSTTGPYGPQQSATGPWTSDRLSFVFPYQIYKNCPGPTECTHMIAGSYRVWETILGAIPGSSWYINSPDLTKNTLADRSVINQLAYAVSDQTMAVVGTNDGNVQIGFNLGTGVANSAIWIDVTGSNAVLPNRPILDVATDPLNPLIAYAAVGGFDENTPATPGHIYRVTCTAGCASFIWLDKSGNLPDIPVDSIIANPLFPQQVFAGTDWGLYFTDDITVGTPVWYRFEAGLPNVMIWDMAIDRSFTTLALFTRSRGAYVWPLPAGPIAANYAVTFFGNSFVSGPLGSSVTHSFILANIGQSDDSYDLSIADNVWNTTLLTGSPISVGAGLTATVEVQVDIPAKPTDLTDSFELTATSVVSPTVQAAATGTTQAVIEAGVIASGDMSGSGLQGEVITYTLAVTNTGNYTDTMDVIIGPHVWTTTSQSASLDDLAPGETRTLEIYVVVGSEDSDAVTITFAAQLDPSATDSAVLTSMRTGAGGTMLFLPMVQKP
jgi:hypothetical protein